MMVFDRDTYEYLGFVYTPPPGWAPSGGPSRSAVLRLAIVDSAGQLP